jgi:hypothetical protein
MKHVLATLLFSFVLGFVGNAHAQHIIVPTPPDKTVVIYNNTKVRIYPVIVRGPFDPSKPNVADLWMQAKFKQFVPLNKTYQIRFTEKLEYRAYINPDQLNPGKGGIAPNGGFVTITLPFYSQLKEVTRSGDAQIGVAPDQFIDWWNAVRIYLFYDKIAANASFITYDNCENCPPPGDVTFLNTINNRKPSCSNSDGSSCFITFKTYSIDPPAGIPFQLQEFTFASATGPLPGGNADFKVFDIQEEWVNYNISSLDSVYLPIAVGPHTKTTLPYVGDGQTAEDFLGAIRVFSGVTGQGEGWPFFIPNYYDSTQTGKGYPVVYGQPCALNGPFAGQNTFYAFAKIPGMFNFLIESFRSSTSAGGTGNTITPPLLSSQPNNFSMLPGYRDNHCVPPTTPAVTTPKLGTVGQPVIDLWKTCTANMNDISPTCKDLRTVYNFFLKNFNKKSCSTNFPDGPDLLSTMLAVYGWVPISAPIYGITCSGDALVLTSNKNEYIDVNTVFCNLQYNYLTLDPMDMPKYVFSPYTKFIHQTLKSSAYAFSIDDKTSFKRIEDNGIILAVGGTNGLKNKNPSPIPHDKQSIKDNCKVE